MNTTDLNTSFKAGTAIGTGLVILTSLGDDVVRTILLSATGAAVSFMVSWLLKYIIGKLSELWQKD